MKRNEKIIILLCVIGVIAAGGLHFTGANHVLTFAIAAVALALLAMIVGDATEQLGSRLGPGATGVLQSSLASLPELFVAIFALRAGLAHVVLAALVGSILGISLLVFGLAPRLLTDRVKPSAEKVVQLTTKPPVAAAIHADVR